MDWEFVGKFGRGEIDEIELGGKGGEETLERVEKRVKLKPLCVRALSRRFQSQEKKNQVSE